MHADDCSLCRDAAAPVLWRDDSCRVVSAADADYPAFLRVIWQAHVREMTDLDPASQQHLLRVVLAVVIPRFADDAHFPDPVWAARRRAGVAHGVDERRMIERLRAALGDSSIA